MKKDDSNFHTIRAARDIISVITESNIIERDGLSKHFEERYKGIPIFNKNTEGISVSIEEAEVYLKIRLNIQKGINIMEELSLLQKRIKEEIMHLTGFNVKQIDLSIEKIISKTELI